MITREELQAIPYHKLKLKFKELNLTKVWKAGDKKEDMIEKALVELEALRQELIKKDLVKFGMDESQIEDIKDEKIKVQITEKDIEKGDEPLNGIDIKPDLKDKTILTKEDKIQARKMKAKLNLTKEEIEEQLRVIELNLINTPCDHIGRVLRDKRAILEAELEKLK